MRIPGLLQAILRPNAFCDARLRLRGDSPVQSEGQRRVGIVLHLWRARNVAVRRRRMPGSAANLRVATRTSENAAQVSLCRLDYLEVRE